jgi:hypothetical protein
MAGRKLTLFWIFSGGAGTEASIVWDRLGIELLRGVGGRFVDRKRLLSRTQL